MRLRSAAFAATSVTVAGAAAVAAGRYAAGAALRPERSGSSSGRVRLPAGFGGPPLTVHTVGDGQISLTRSLTAQLPGVYGLVGRDGHAVVGPVLDGEPSKAPADTVVRRLERVARGELRPGSRVWLTPQLYADDSGTAGTTTGTDTDAGTDTGTGEAGGRSGRGSRTAVEIPGELGPLPAWFVPGARDTWVVTLHGLGATPDQALPLLPFYESLQLPVLGLAYRGDAGAPPPPDGVRHLGDTEWRDVEAAIRYAVGNGASRVVLHGWSSGASMALRAAEELNGRAAGAGAGGDSAAGAGVDGDAAGRIAGLVLDSPVLDWWGTVRALAVSRHTPRALLPLAVRAAQGRARVQPERMRQIADPAAADVPTLLLHGPDDTVASWQRSKELALARPESVTLHTVPSAPHAAMWNADPEAYEENLRRFLTPLM
jgi:alpha-beta hydrolase superfamily lysophospholipase